MASKHRRTIAFGILMALAACPDAWAASGARMKFAAPAAQEETIYRPECPSGETSSTWLPCRVAGASGG